MKTKIAPHLSSEVISIIRSKYHKDDLITGSGNKTYRLIPGELNNVEPGHEYWVHKTKYSAELLSYGITLQEFYDLFILGIDYIEDRPKCLNPECNNLVNYQDINRGYHSYCCKSCSAIGTIIKELGDLLDKFDNRKIDNLIISPEDNRFNILTSLNLKYNYNNLTRFNGTSKIQYFIVPELVIYEIDSDQGYVRSCNSYDNGFDTNWISSLYFDKYLKATCQLDIQEYFDLIFLNINNKLDRPRCSICGDEVPFKGNIIKGYGSGDDWYCSKNCSLYAGGIHLLNNFKFNFGTEVSYYSNKFNKIYTLKSKLEYQSLLLLESDPNIIDILYESWDYSIDYDFEGVKRHYLPDFIVKYTDSIKIIEVKPKELLNDPKVISKSMSALEFCKKYNYTYLFMCEDGEFISPKY